MERHSRNGARKRGRPREEGARRHYLKTLCSDSEIDKIKSASRKYGVTQSDIIRRGIEMYIRELESSNAEPNEEFFDYDYWDEDYYEDLEDEENDDENWN